MLQDPELNHPFSHPGSIYSTPSGWRPTGQIMGGPPRYSESCGDQSTVLYMHAGNGDMGDLGHRFVECFVRATDDAGLPDDPEFRAALRAYMQVAVDEALDTPRHLQVDALFA